jgi:hypothetical protein
VRQMVSTKGQSEGRPSKLKSMPIPHVLKIIRVKGCVAVR